MRALYAEPTDDAPGVSLDAQKSVYEIWGESRPENAFNFYSPILQWLEDFKALLFWEKNEFNKNRKVNFSFKLDYFNSTSAKYILDILVALEKIKTDGFDISASWHYRRPDEDMLEAGEEFAKSLATLELKMFPY